MILILRSICLFVILSIAAVAWGGDKIAYIAYAEGFWQVWVVGVDGSQSRMVTSSPYDKSKLSWAPDAETLLVNGSQGEVCFVDIATGHETAVNLGLSDVADAVLSFDGSQIAFSAVAAGVRDRNDIWVYDIPSKSLSKLTNMRGLQHEPAWAPGGESIYFLSRIPEDHSPDHDIYRIKLSGAQNQLTAGRGLHFDVSVGSDGALLYSSNWSGDYEIWLQQPEQAPVNLSSNTARDVSPSWSADESQIVFESSRNGVSNIWRTDIQGGEAVRLTNHERGARAPVWYRGPQ